MIASIALTALGACLYVGAFGYAIHQITKGQS